VLKVDDTIADPAAAENIEVSQIAHAIQSSTDCMDSLRRYFLIINKRAPADAGEKPLQKGRAGYASPSADNIVLPMPNSRSGNRPKDNFVGIVFDRTWLDELKAN
jgi:hypothetical protein